MTPEQLNPEAKYWKDWHDQMNTLCHEIFFNTDAGKSFLKMMEERYFYGPTCAPEFTERQSCFNEGRNNFIRGLRKYAYDAMKPKQATQLQKDTEYEIES